MDRVAETPVMIPERATRRVLARAKVRPASTPVSSTSASFRPRTMAPTYCRRSSSSIAASCSSCLCSSSMIPAASGISRISCRYFLPVVYSFFSIKRITKVYPISTPRRLYQIICQRLGCTSCPVYFLQIAACSTSSAAICSSTARFCGSFSPLAMRL